MKNKDKRKKYILKLFKDFSDEEILEIYNKNFIISKISNNYAKEILKKYNKYYLPNNKEFKINYYELCECIEYRNLKYKENLFNVEVSLESIIEQLKKNWYEEIDIIEKNYLKDYYSGTNLKLVEVNNEYTNIITNLKNGYLLIGTLNLLNVPGFVFPIFKKDNKYYFQSSEEGQVIDSFYEITREDVIKKIKFLNLNSLNISFKNVTFIYNVGDAPIAAYLYDDKLFISDTNSMIEYLDSLDITNDVMKREIEVFKEDVKGNYQKRR